MIPPEAFDADIPDFAFRLLAVVCHLAGQEGHVEASVADLGTRTRGASDKTVRRALKALEEASLIRTEQTRSTGGNWGVLRIYPSVTFDRPPSVIFDRTEVIDSSPKAAVELTSNDLSQGLIDNVSNAGTSYLRDSASAVAVKVVKVKREPMRFVDDDGDLAGFGLLEEKSTQKNVNKSDPKTRGRRPQHEWTPTDVAAEFQHRVGKKFYWLPGTLNIRRLSGALAKNRREFGVTALIELEMLDMFMADERNFLNVGNEAPDLYRKYLRMFTTKMNTARENVGLDALSVIETPKTGSLVASDGRTFDDTISGRVALRRHEERITRGA